MQLFMFGAHQSVALCGHMANLPVMYPTRILLVMIAGAMMSLILSMSAEGTEPVYNPEGKIKLPAPDKILDSLKSDHPRLLVEPDSFNRVKKLIETNETAKGWFEKVKARGEKQLKEPVTKYEIRDGKRLLFVSRETKDRAITLGLLYKVTGEEKYKKRIWQDMEALAEFPDWNPSHFLDVAEMALAVSIANDWLYDDWSAAQQKHMEDLLVKYALNVALAHYENRAKDNWWIRATHNWNQVCNGGIGVAALAIGDKQPELAGKVLHHALARLPFAMALYAPDGGYHEGPGYWNYGTRYNVFILSALDTALGKDFGLSDLPGMDKAGQFPIHIQGPTGKTFNFGDGGRNPPEAALMFWLARRYDRPDYAAYQLREAKPDALDLVWFEEDAKADLTKQPLVQEFKRIGVVVMRSNWDKDAAFVGLKVGDNRFNHGNLDMGSFVLDMQGKRWGHDLGADNYNMPGYFSSGATGQRWTYWRMRAESHSTLVINPDKKPDQDPTAEGKVVSIQQEDSKVTVETDITAGYARHAKSARRTYELDQKTKKVTVSDKVELKQAGEVYWFFITDADIKLNDDGRVALLTQDKKTLQVTLSGQNGARFSILDASPLPGTPDPSMQAKNPDYRRLTIHVNDTKKVDWSVTFSPVD